MPLPDAVKANAGTVPPDPHRRRLAGCRSDKRLCVNVQLVNGSEGGNHVWAERFDRDIADIFDLQDEVTRRVVEAISGKLGNKNFVARLA